MPIKLCPRCLKKRDWITSKPIKTQLKRNRKGGHRLYCPVCGYCDVA